MRAGSLRHQVTLQQLGTRADDGAAGGSIPFVDVATGVWGRFEQLSGEELFAAQRFDAKISCLWVIRYYSGIKPSWRLKFGARVFDIKRINDVEERHREMELFCEELLAW